MNAEALLALDLGTTTGWAMLTPGASVVSGTMSFKPGRFEGGGMRYLRFRRWLTELKATTEDGAHRGRVLRRGAPACWRRCGACLRRRLTGHPDGLV